MRIIVVTGIILTVFCTGNDALSARTMNLNADPVVSRRVLELDPGCISEHDVRAVLARLTAPRIININGSVPAVTMDSFSKFLIAMGYPEEKIIDPASGSYSYSSYLSSEKLAGRIAWYYEKDGLMPLLIGHSQGGMMAIRVLHELDGAFHDTLMVWNPLTDREEGRSTIVDPIDGSVRPVIGLRLGFASAAATGSLMRVLLGQWRMIGKLRKIPDTVEEFTGLYIPYDPIGSDFFGFGKANNYAPTGSARVRNVRLPSSYHHLTIPLSEPLARDSEIRAWIDKYVPGNGEPLVPPDIREKGRNILFAAEMWYYIKKYWTIELQRLVRAQTPVQ